MHFKGVQGWHREAKNGIIDSMWQKIKNLYHLTLAILANIYFGFPSRKFRVVGVTGTDGKTTTVSLIYHILNTAGKNASMISSVGAIIGGKNYDIGFHVTTPSPFALQRFIKKITEGIKKKEENYLVLETTSHALDQYRVFGIKFDIGVLTNVTHEHLDYHKTYANYVKAKSKLLLKSKIAIVNRDDESYEMINNKGLMIKNKTKLITYGMRKNADVNPFNFPFETKMIGKYNKYNILAAIAVCKKLGLTEKEIQNGIESFSPPTGRSQIVHDDSFKVMIDFAHTPNAFEQILSALRPYVRGRLIHVFGSAGKRDHTKRPEMGKISSKYADIIILTAEDPRSESVDKINRQIESQILNFQFLIFNQNKNFKFEKNKKYYFKINNRQEAINAAIKIAEKDDLVIITGKAHEKSMNNGHGEEPWDEFEAVKIALKELKLKN
ncbi:MAG: UDP-N-acetylmuramoyl-L-alanyl-D-glutamate--2,6-diaminopimelate ligase [Patescibacteria group bacterium]|nr:UDP-N-acetylmuramoyl-L-alanyl-D-glutamate--2,6-diaminopimelate ligase [Patescibacteria group bacterium]